MRTALMSTTLVVCGALAAVFAAPAQANRVNFAVSINVPLAHGVVVGANVYRAAPVVVIGQPVVFVPAPVVVFRSRHYGHHHHNRFRNDFRGNRGYRGNGQRY